MSQRPANPTSSLFLTGYMSVHSTLNVQLKSWWSSDLRPGRSAEEPCSHHGTDAHYSVCPPGDQLGGGPGQTQNPLEGLYLHLAWERLETPREEQESINGLHN